MWKKTSSAPHRAPPPPPPPPRKKNNNNNNNIVRLNLSMMPDLGKEESGVHWVMGQTNQSGHCGEMGDCTYSRYTLYVTVLCNRPIPI